MSKGKLTLNQLEYKKQIRRIKQAINRLKIKGVEIDYTIPRTPKRVTKQHIAKLKKVTPKFLRQTATINESKRNKQVKGLVDDGIKSRYKEENNRSRVTSDKQNESYNRLIKIKETDGKRVKGYRDNELYKKFRKERRRIKELIERAEKRGYTFSEDLKNRIGQTTMYDLQYLISLKPKNLYEESKWTDPQTGKVHSGLEGRHIENVRRGKKAAETRKRKERIIIDRIPKKSAINSISNLLVEYDEDFRLLWYRIYYNEYYHAPKTMTEIWNDTVNIYEEKGLLSELEEYANEHFGEIQHTVDVIYWASKEESKGMWSKFNAELLMLLRVGEMPTRTELELYNDTYAFGEIIDLVDLINDEN